MNKAEFQLGKQPNFDPHKKTHILVRQNNFLMKPKCQKLIITQFDYVRISLLTLLQPGSVGKSYFPSQELIGVLPCNCHQGGPETKSQDEERFHGGG
jgi:hypothetical protein